jgi:hypothetical protein
MRQRRAPNAMLYLGSTESSGLPFGYHVDKLGRGENLRKGVILVKWKQVTAAGMEAKEAPVCTMCHNPTSEAVFCAEDFEELQCLLLERDSGLGVKLMDFDKSQPFCVCEDCKIKVDEELKANSVHIMHCD